MGFFKVYRRGHRGAKDKNRRKQPWKSRGKKSGKRKEKKPWKGRIMAWEYAQT